MPLMSDVSISLHEVSPLSPPGATLHIYRILTAESVPTPTPTLTPTRTRTVLAHPLSRQVCPDCQRAPADRFVPGKLADLAAATADRQPVS